MRVLLIVPFVALLVLTAVSTAYFSFRNGRNAVNEVIGQLRSQLAAGIEDHLNAFLGPSHKINQLNASALRQGLLDAADAAALERHFWGQIKICDSVTSIYFGNADGGLVDAGREGPSGLMYLIATDGFGSGPFKKYATDDRGNRTDLLATVPDFDARNRPWYAGAVEKNGACWSDIYILYTGQDMAIAASLPVYDAQQKFLGVVAADIFLSHISDFLRSLEIGKTGQAFIMERSGWLVAASGDEAAFIRSAEGRAAKRLHASESSNRIIQKTAEFLIERYGDYQHIHEVQYLELSPEGQRCFLQVVPIKDGYGLDWLIAVVIPEADFMGRIDAHNRTTAFFILAALAAVIIIGVVAAQLITRPIIQLRASARALARNEWTRPFPDDSRIREISELTRSFSIMAGQLQQSLEGLTKEIVERKMAEDAIRAALNEKEILLREIHHRVKNNLQIVISLLNLQASQLKNPAMAAALHISQQRIRAMAMIHETLHGSLDLAAIDLSTYLTNLVQHLYGVFTGQTDARFTVQADEILLDMDQAIACGLIINELVTNALKYAFPGIVGGRIRVSARRIEGTQVELTVSDNGVGLSSDFDLSKASSLGLQLVRGLVQHQLAGTCRVHVNGGMTVTIQWPLRSERT